MHERGIMYWTEVSSRHDNRFLTRVCSFLLLLLPTGVLSFLAYRTGQLPVAVGAGIQALFILVFLRAHPIWRPPVSVSVVVLYLIALVWAWLPLQGSTDWIVHIGQGLLLLGGITLLAVHELYQTGAEPVRRANSWMRRISERSQWPLQLADCRTLPEAAALRESIRDEPGPALALLSDPRPEVQATALGALEHRANWRPGEAELVLRFGRESREPAVRVAAVYALAGVDTADLVSNLAGFLRDPAAEVRLATAEAIMWNADSRWPFTRESVKEALADPKLAEEGALFVGIGRLPAAAVADLITWSAEHAPLAQRAILTLMEHYHADLIADDRPELGSELAAMMLAQDTPPPLRVELAALLRDHNLLSPDLLDRLTNPDQPGPIRLFAAELMLRINPHDPDGVDVLRGLARQPNREMAVRVAAVLQNVLGLDLGLLPGELPMPNSKPAADVARRVVAWANGSNPDVFRSTPGPRAGIKPGSRPSTKAVASRPKTGAVPPTSEPIHSASSEESEMFPVDESAMLPDQSALMEREDLPIPRTPPPRTPPPRTPRPGSSAVL
jgi:hypothetical protein